MSDVDTVRELNSVFARYDFHSLRDAAEASDPEAVTSGFAELDDLLRRSLAPDVAVEFLVDIPLPEGRRYGGLDEYLRLWRAWLAAFDEYDLEHGNYEQVDDWVVVDVVHRGRGRGSGLEFALPQTQLWRLRDGVVLAIRIHGSRDDAFGDLRRRGNSVGR